RGVGDGTMPVRNARLLERCGARHGIVEPRDVQRALVVDRHAPLELGREETVRPQADAADRPELVVLCRVLAHAAINEAPLELLERDLQMARGPRTGLAPHRSGPLAISA